MFRGFTFSSSGAIVQTALNILRAWHVSWLLPGLEWNSCLRRIIAAVKNIDALMLTRVWQGLEYRIDVCRVTRGAHIEVL
jgi:hypothetical protein